MTVHNNSVALAFLLLLCHLFFFFLLALHQNPGAADWLCVSIPVSVCVVDENRDGGGDGGLPRVCVCRLGARGWRGCESLGCKKVHRYLSPSARCLAVMGSCLHAAPKASGSRRVHLPGTSCLLLSTCVYLCVCTYRRGGFALTIYVHVSTQGTLDWQSNGLPDQLGLLR